ncbi:hypothetical protein JZ751_014472 [Albula glossodonta]|uniref:Uncharacterized protein n=1 Tax=Albula glossodonta TaxID=121402 RepID=A0A8T2N4W9_9TELE|nr:hypothetical protein JZ751_014472 [Albula glossodonta]
MAMDSSSTSLPTLAYHNVGDYYPRKLGPKPDVVPSGVTERKVSPLDKPDMVVVDVINIKEPVHRKKHATDTYVLGTIKPFRKTQRSFLGKFTQEFALVASDRQVARDYRATELKHKTLGWYSHRFPSAPAAVVWPFSQITRPEKHWAK